MATTAWFGVLQTSVLAQAVIDGGASVTVIGTGGGTQVSPWDVNGMLTIGDVGDGTLTISDGGTVTNTGANLGDSVSSTGTVVMTGSTSQWQSSGTVFVGFLGQGVVNVTDATLEASSFFLAQGNGTIGTMTVSGPTAVMRTTDGMGIDLSVGWSGTGELNVSDGATVEVEGDMVIANSTGGDDSSVTVDDAFIEVVGDLTIGNYATGGTLTVQNGGEVTIDGNLRIGETSGEGTVSIIGPGSELEAADTVVGSAADGEGTLIVDGLGARLSAAELTVGEFGTGTVRIAAGGLVDTDDVRIGLGQDSTGQVVVEGADAVWEGDEMTVGDEGQGLLEVKAGAEVLSSYGAIGVAGTGLGQVVVDGEDTLWDVSGNLIVGVSGNGELIIRNEASVNSANVSIGQSSGSVGSMTVAGEGSSWTSTSGASDLFIGLDGVGSLTVAAGGLVDQGSGSASVGVGSDGSGSVLVTGDGSQWNTTADIRVGAASAGIITITDGGAVSSDELTLGVNSGIDGTLNIGAASGAPAERAGALDTLDIMLGFGNGTLVFNHTDSGYVFGADLALAEAGNHQVLHEAGDTILAGDWSAFNGTTLVSGGALHVNGAIGGVTDVVGGKLGGNGTVADLTVGNGGTLAPGNSVGTLNVSSANFVAGSVLEIELNDGGWDCQEFRA